MNERDKNVKEHISLNRTLMVLMQSCKYESRSAYLMFMNNRDTANLDVVTRVMINQQRREFEEQ